MSRESIYTVVISNGHLRLQIVAIQFFVSGDKTVVSLYIFEYNVLLGPRILPDCVFNGDSQFHSFGRCFLNPPPVNSDVITAYRPLYPLPSKNFEGQWIC